MTTNPDIITVINPSLIESILKPLGILARYIFVLESEANEEKKTVPRFSVGGARANKNPNLIPLSELYEITHDNFTPVSIPRGWSKVHEFIYILGVGKDYQGYEYRSDWTDGQDPGNEPWTADSNDANVKRRIWMVTAVPTEHVQAAKDALTDVLQKEDAGEGSTLLRGVLEVQETGVIGKRWEEREVVLKKNHIEVFTSDNRMLKNISLKDAYCARTIVAQLPERQFSFVIRQKCNGMVLCIFAASSYQALQKWIHAVGYQIAIMSPSLNFSALPHAPPCEDECPETVRMFGMMMKKGHWRKNWKSRFFVLTPYELQYYQGMDLKGKVPLRGSALVRCDSSLAF